MKIRKLQLKNIGVFDDMEIEFQSCPEGKAEIHILTGQNGTGKSSILQALAIAFNPHKGPSIINLDELANKFHKRFHQERDYYNVNVEFDKKTKIKMDFHKFGGKFELKEPESSNYIFPLLNLRAYKSLIKSINLSSTATFTFATFAFSSYRQIETENVQANYLPKNFNPLSQSLEFIKDYRKEGEITINQLVANNISNRALSKEDGSLEEAKKYETVINSIETFIKDVTDYEVKFVLKRSPNELKLKIHGEELDFDVLPDGLRSLISWIADLLGRVDLLKWEDDLPITEKNLILLLDEIEVHLHPAWQRKVLPVVQNLFKNAQIFVSTHSPFVVNSVDDAWVYKLELENGKAKVSEPIKSEDGISYQTVLSEIFGINEEFGGKTQEDLDKFYKIIRNGKEFNENELIDLAKSLAVQSEELNSIVQIELNQLNRKRGTNLTL